MSDETKGHKEVAGTDQKMTLTDLEEGALVTVDGENGTAEGAAAGIPDHRRRDRWFRHPAN